MKTQRSLELLSPAKNLEQGIAAINHGADALYVGAPRFGAREGATNTLEDVESLVRYAHRYHSKVFVVMNTIVYEDELIEAERMAKWAYNAGADALIVQDMAFMEMNLPPIALHASTQTNNVSIEKVKFLENVGFERVILARELSLSQITAISQNTNVELEAFVHGALCVSYSGQCYLSESIVGRSANRGACSQPCRSAYNLIDEQGKTYLKGKHLLSLKDFSMQHSLRELADAGVSSFKIEGRLKNIDYVKNITALYRKELDAILEDHPADYQKASSGKAYFGFTPDASKSFNRGFTSYFAHNRPEDLTGFHTAKATGAPIGKVTSIGSSFFVIDGQTPLSNGDGVCFIAKNGTLVGTNINVVEGSKIYPSKMEGITKGVQIFRNYDHQFSRQLDGGSTQRLVDAAISFQYDGKQVTIVASDEDGCTAQLTISQAFDLAQKEDKATGNIRQQLGKSGSTLFNVNHVDVSFTEAPFIPISQLNSFRRDILEALEQQRTRLLPRRSSSIIPNSIPYPEQALSYAGNVVNSLARKFYERHGVSTIDDGFELTHAAGANLMTTKYCIRYELGACLKTKDGNKLPSNLFLENNGKKFRLIFDCKKCQMMVREE